VGAVSGELIAALSVLWGSLVIPFTVIWIATKGS
jgi:hypothetical protein